MHESRRRIENGFSGDPIEGIEGLNRKTRTHRVYTRTCEQANVLIRHAFHFQTDSNNLIQI